MRHLELFAHDIFTNPLRAGAVACFRLADLGNRSLRSALRQANLLVRQCAAEEMDIFTPFNGNHRVK
jgi:hypothetical protein